MQRSFFFFSRLILCFTTPISSPKCLAAACMQSHESLLVDPKPQESGRRSCPRRLLSERSSKKEKEKEKMKNIYIDGLLMDEKT